MRIALITIFIFWLNSTHAQITITNAQMPLANDTIRYSRALSTAGVSALLGKKGLNSWDFSFLTAGTQDVYSYKNSFSTPYAFYFINKLGLKTADSLGISIVQFKNIYTFYSSSKTVFKALGLGYSYSGIPLAANYIDEDEIYKLPLNFSDSTTNSFDFKFELPAGNLFSVRQKGTRTNVVEAYGSLKTPYKTYDSVLLVKTIIDEIDSLNTQFAKLGIPRKQISYKWLSKTEKIPALEIIGSMIGGNFQVQQVLYRDAYVNTPNPLISSFTVDKTTGIENTDIFTFTNSSFPAQAASNWSFTPNNVKFMNGTSASSKNPQVQFTQAGIYNVKLRSTLATFVKDTIVTNLITIGVNSAPTVPISSNKIYPQPCNGTFYYTGNWKNMSIINSLGQQVNYIKTQNKVELLNASAGIYIIQYQLHNKQEFAKLVVEY